MTSDVISAKDIKAQLPHPILTRVFGEPTHKQVKMVIRKLSVSEADYTPYSTRLFLVRPTKVRRYTCDKARPLSQV